MRLGLRGEIGRDYHLEGASDLSSSNRWQFLLSLRLTNDNQGWFDSASLALTQRFYRVVALDAPAPLVRANDFRLIDHQGVSRALYYPSNNASVRAYALIFTGNGCAGVRQMIATIKTLRNQFTPQGVIFWMIDSNPADTRSNIVAEATAQGIDLPILHDRAQLVAGDFGASATPEVVCVSVPDFTIFYRGSIDDRMGANPIATTQHYLSDALTAYLAGDVVTPMQTVPAGCAIPPNPRPSVAYSTDIAPLLQNKCVSCHSPGNIAPWAMTNYNIVQTYASLIKAEVLAGRMPPWHADYNYAPATNDFSLAPDQAAQLVQWINDGAPRGSGSDPLAVGPPSPTNYPYAFPASLGPPAAVLRIPVQNIPATGVLDYRYISVANTFVSNVWLRAAIVRPGNTRVVHHVLVYNSASSQLMGLDGFFAGYVPGYEATTFPPNTGKLLRPGEVLTFQMHYITSGTNETDQTEIGLYTLPSAPVYPLQTKSAFNPAFVLGTIPIPSGASDFQITAQYPIPPLFGNPAPTLTTNILIFEVSPHMHLRGARFKYEVVYANGSREPLLSVPRYEFHWQTLYRLTTPKYVPRGARLVCTGAWDNSAQNRDNPDPSATVWWGDQTFNEMFIGYFNFAEVP